MTEEQPRLADALSAAAKKSRLSTIASDEAPTGAAILASIGGVRGLAESVLPSFVFLVVFLLTKHIALSTLIPLGVAVVFIIVRAATRLAITPAIVGAVGVGITAAFAILTDRPENNFVPGLLTNAVFLVVLLISLIARRPLIGVIVSLLVGERVAGWRGEPRLNRVFTIATWLWVGLFAIRLGVELPLYFASNAVGLGIAKLILGLPFYAAVLWVTWLLVRSVLPPVPTSVEGESPKVS